MIRNRYFVGDVEVNLECQICYPPAGDVGELYGLSCSSTACPVRLLGGSFVKSDLFRQRYSFLA